MHSLSSLNSLSDDGAFGFVKALATGEGKTTFRAETPRWFISQVVSLSQEIKDLGDDRIEVAAVIPVVIWCEDGREKDIMFDGPEFFTEGDAHMIEGNLMNAFQVATDDPVAESVTNIRVARDLATYRMLEVAMKSSMRPNDVTLKNTIYSEYWLDENSDSEPPTKIVSLPGVSGFFSVAIKVNIELDRNAFVCAVKRGSANLLVSYEEAAADRLFRAANDPCDYAFEGLHCSFIEDLIANKLSDYGVSDVYSGWLMPLSSFPRNLSTILSYAATVIKMEEDAAMDAETRYAGDFMFRILELPNKVSGEMYSEGVLVWRCHLPNKRWSTASAHYESRMLRRILDLRFACEVVITRHQDECLSKKNWMERLGDE